MNEKFNYLKTNGVDVDAGLGFLGDESMYNEILSDFKDNFVNQMNDIKVKFESKDWDNYVILVHALKSNCKTLGITSLAELSFNHEMKGKEKDYDYINSHVTELFNKANEVYDILNNYFKM